MGIPTAGHIDSCIVWSLQSCVCLLLLFSHVVRSSLSSPNFFYKTVQLMCQQASFFCSAVFCSCFFLLRQLRSVLAAMLSRGCEARKGVERCVAPANIKSISWLLT